MGADVLDQTGVITIRLYGDIFCQRGQPIVADVHVSMATRDAIARSITELVRATGFLFDNLIQPHQQFPPGKKQRVNAPANFRALSAQDSFAVPP